MPGSECVYCVVLCLSSLSAFFRGVTHQDGELVYIREFGFDVR